MNVAWKLAVLCSFGVGCAAGRQQATSVAEPAAAAGSVQLEEDAAPAELEYEDEEARVARLQREREAFRAEQQGELERLSPALRTQAKALADRSYPSGRAALQAALEGPHRRPSHRARDGERHALQTLEFLGFEPTDTVLEYGPGDGWYTELLAPALAKQGKLLVTSIDAQATPEPPSTLDAERFKALLDALPELYGKLQLVHIDPSRPELPKGTKLDMVLLFDDLHEMVNAGTLKPWLTVFHEALGRRGVLGIVQRRAPAGSDPRDSVARGALPQEWVVTRLQIAGFKLTESSEVNAASGEADQMTLKFVKVEEPPPMSPFVP